VSSEYHVYLRNLQRITIVLHQTYGRSGKANKDHGCLLRIHKLYHSVRKALNRPKRMTLPIRRHGGLFSRRVDIISYLSVPNDAHCLCLDLSIPNFGIFLFSWVKLFNIDEGQHSTDECGAYLTHFSRILKPPEQPPSSVSASDPLSVGLGSESSNECSQRTFTGALGSLMLHGEPREHWNESLVDALLALVGEGALASEKEAPGHVMDGHINMNRRHDEIPTSNLSKDSAMSSDGQIEDLSSVFFSVNSAFWHISKWPGGSIGLAQGTCMQSLAAFGGLLHMQPATDPEAPHIHTQQHANSRSRVSGANNNSDGNRANTSRYSPHSGGTALPAASSRGTGQVVKRPAVDPAAFKASAFVAAAANITTYSNAM
jgi:hypothetical protein